MNNPISLLTLCVCCMVMACQPKQEQAGQEQTSGDHTGHANHQTAAQDDQKEKTLYDEVIEIHDEVMPRMDDIMKLKSQLNAVLEGTQEAAEPVNEERKKAIQAIIEELEAADKGMMGWMRGFRPMDGSNIDEEAKKYLEEEKVKITEVKNNMLNAIAHAEQALAERE